MPIRYSVSPDGHIVRAVATAPLSSKEFVEYEIDHAVDERIKPPVSELLEIRYGAMDAITKDDVSKVLQRRKGMKKTNVPHRCAIVVTLTDAHAWEIAKFYEGMVILHYPEIVIVFGDIAIAETWLGLAKTDSR